MMYERTERKKGKINCSMEGLRGISFKGKEMTEITEEFRGNGSNMGFEREMKRGNTLNRM